MTSTHTHGAEPLQKWPELVKQHLTLLKDHLRIWTTIRDEQTPDSINHRSATSCVDRTNEMINSFTYPSAEQYVEPVSHVLKPNTQQKDVPMEHQIGSSSKVGKTPENLTIRSTKKRRLNETALPLHSARPTKIHKDNSRLFTLDSNPIPLEDVSSQATQRSSTLANHFQPSQNLHSAQTKREDQQPFLSSNATGQDYVELDNQNDAEHMNNFLGKVWKRYEENVARTTKKSDKKRKRDSRTSVESNEINEQSKVERKKKKRFKQSSLVKY